MKPKLITNKIVLTLLVLTLAGWAAASCGGSSSNSSSSTQQQQTSEQTAQKAPSSTTASSSDSATQLIGTWKATSAEDTSLPAGTTLTLTFSDDGTLQQEASNGSESANEPGQCEVLKNSRLSVSTNGKPKVYDYSVNGDTLTLTTKNGVTSRYQRAG